MATINVEVQATIRRPLAVVSRQFGDMRHHERHRVHPDISFTVLSEEGGDCRFRQEVRLLGMLQSDEIVQHRNADGSLSSEVVTGANKACASTRDLHRSAPTRRWSRSAPKRPRRASSDG